MVPIQRVEASAWGADLRSTVRISQTSSDISDEVAKRSLMSCHAVRYVLLKNQKDLNAPVVLHFHGSGVELIHEITSQQGMR